jgi:hypothetical protein
LAVFFSTVVFTVVLLTVSFFAVSVPIFMLSFDVESGVMAESIFIVDAESTEVESEVLAELFPLHAAMLSDNAKATNGSFT